MVVMIDSEFLFEFNKNLNWKTLLLRGFQSFRTDGIIIF